MAKVRFGRVQGVMAVAVALGAVACGAVGGVEGSPEVSGDEGPSGARPGEAEPADDAPSLADPLEPGDDGKWGRRSEAGEWGTKAGSGRECDVSGTPDVAGCLVDDAHAVFVAPSAEEGDGSMGRPARSIRDAIAVAVARGVKRVILCEGTYRETVRIMKARAGVSLFGGFSCPADGAWTYTGVRSRVESPIGTALLMDGVTERTTIQDIDFQGADAVLSTYADSSIAAIVHRSALTFRRVSITAGKGGTGADGASGPAGGAASDAAATSGSDATCDARLDAEASGGASTAVPWPSRGGAGGISRGGTAQSGGMGLPLRDDTGSDGFGGAAASSLGASGEEGRPGARGRDGAPGAPAYDIGSFTSMGYWPANGHDGADGDAGQGGGGGGASPGSDTCSGAGGGAGGIGGDGGKHGAGGSGGGASVALLSWDSSIFLEATSLFAAGGGDGGNGGHSGSGGNGAKGGRGGHGHVSGIGAGGDGGAGAAGGGGGAGSGGSGGPSFTVVFHGAPVLRDAISTVDAGPAGKGGKGGARAGAPEVGVAADGTRGARQIEYEQR